MNQTRSFLMIAWLVVAGMLWMAWNQAPTPATTTPGNASVAMPIAHESNPGNTQSVASALPGADNSAAAAPVENAATPEATHATITLRNDVLELTVDLDGGRLIGSKLLGYAVEKKPGSPNVELLSSDSAHYFNAQSGLIAVNAQQQTSQLPESFHTVDGGRSYSLPPGAQALSVPLQWTDPASGLTVRRTLTLARDSYVLDETEQVSNGGARAQRLYPFVQLERVTPPPPAKHYGLTNPEAFSFVGAAWYSPEDKFEKTKFDEFAKKGALNKTVTGGWIAMPQHHFVTAWVPDANTTQLVSLATENRDGIPLYRIRSVSVPIDLAPGATQKSERRIWVGPKLQKQLAALAPGLKLTLDYGMFTFIAQPLFDYVLRPLHFLTGNWGWAIILTVVLLKIFLYPLSAAQFRSMAKMRAVQPRIEALKERYGDDKQQFQIAMMELYKKEKINPIGGCLPMLIPLPIFFALYWVLIETAELRHAPWMGWIQSLSDPDPYFILPVLNLAVMFLTQKMTPTPGMDPAQKKMMQFMPLVFGVMMAFFPAGLVLYWVTNGLLGLLQQQYITRKHGQKPAAGTVR